MDGDDRFGMIRVPAPPRPERGRYRFIIIALLVCAVLLQPGTLPAKPVAVRYEEGLLHGFLVLRTLDGNPIADGDLMQTARGSRVTSHLILRFKDSSTHEETAVFSQRGTFRLLSYHLVQKGPSFKHPMEISIDVPKGLVNVRYTEDDGKEKTINERMRLPSDIANGIFLMLLKDVSPAAPQTTVSMLVATPKPRLIKLEITPQAEESFLIGGLSHKATHYLLKVKIGGAAGLVAPIIGKEPPDLHAWIQYGEAPTFVKSELPLYEGGPTWRIELTSPVWLQSRADSTKNSQDGRISFAGRAPCLGIY